MFIKVHRLNRTYVIQLERNFFSFVCVCGGGSFSGAIYRPISRLLHCGRDKLVSIVIKVLKSVLIKLGRASRFFKVNDNCDILRFFQI